MRAQAAGRLDTGEVIASSETYESKASALNGIESVKRNAPNAEVDDQTSS